ncbi:MAG: outer membrane homotrimeric porin [Desulfovibrionaceae bacterium]|nr:outer membrane homotrimeric porin [Desulfovibrionaceae bacterium]
MKKHATIIFLAASIIFGSSASASAIDFKAKGEWRVAFGLGNATLHGGKGAPKDDLFGATQRLRLQLDAVASENLSGRVWFEIGYTDWGKNGNGGSAGGALGADGVTVKVKNAYLDWIVPDTDLKFRMGLQNFTLPNAAGGSAILGSADVAGVSLSYQVNDSASATLFWLRPVNDNFEGTWGKNKNRSDAHYLDNLDLVGLSLPLTFTDFGVAPWVMYGFMGRNALDEYQQGWTTLEGNLGESLFANVGSQPRYFNFRHTKAYTSLFFAGLPVQIATWDPLSIELDFNYGYVEGFGRDAVKNFKTNLNKQADSRREGWLIKGLVEYKMEWGVPGIFGWYASGDDGDVKNGSERMPSIKANGKFTSFMGAGGQDFWPANSFKGSFNEKKLAYAGTWGIGLQVRDMSFMEDLRHTLRIAYWGGTNDPGMVKYFQGPNAFDNANGYEGPYLTKNDGLIEINVDNSYKIYENLELGLDLGYIVNCMDQGTWQHSRAWQGENVQRGRMSKHDAWKAQLTFNYTF